MTADRKEQEPVMTATAVAVTTRTTTTTATATATITRPSVSRQLSSMSYTSVSIGRVPGSRRERLRSLARTTQQVIKQEISKYYGPPSAMDMENEFSSRPTSGQDQRPPPLPPRPTRSASETTYSSSSSSYQNSEIADPSAAAAVLDTVKPYCMLFPTYASRTNKGDKWKMRLTGWTYAMPGSSRLERWIVAAGRSYGGLMANSTEDAHFIRLLNQFRCQTLRSIELKLSIVDVVPVEQVLSSSRRRRRRLSGQPPSSSSSSDDDDDDGGHRHRSRLHEKIRNKTHDIIEALSVNSGSTGRFEETLTLDLANLLDKTQHKMLRLVASFDTIAESSSHDGYVDLIEPEGISIISDIDDTIKITNVPDGRDAVLQSTFFKKADQVPGMSAVYRQWAGHGMHVHYVSNSPWQVYFNLSDFIQDQQFPPGSMHLRVTSASDLFRKKVSQHKTDVIAQILEDFPNRKFILIGDSGERDPEVYREMYDRYPHQVVKIFIHDVSSDRARHADQREVNRSDSFYNIIRKYVSRDQAPSTPPAAASMSGSSYFRPQRNGTSTSALMDAIGEADVPEEEKIIEDPAVPLKTKLDLFNERMAAVSEGLPPGTFSLFTIASQLLTDPVMATIIHESTSRPQQES